MSWPTRIKILGFDGTGQEPLMEQIGERSRPVWRERFPDATAADLDLAGHPARTGWNDIMRDHLFAWFVAQGHNELVEPLTRHTALEATTQRAVAEADAAYSDLNKNTTINWLAAHHRFVLATRRARDLLTEYAELTTYLAGRDPNFLHGDKELSGVVYDRYVPHDQHLILPTRDYADAVQLDLTSFTETSTERFEILRATITGSYPPGFAQAPTDVTAEWSGGNIPVSPALALADKAMRIPGPRCGDPSANTRNW